MRYRLVIFDFDGTLADSNEWMKTALNRAAERYGFRQVSSAEIEMLRGRDNRAIVKYLGVPAWKLPMIANYMRKLAAADAETMPLFAGAGAMLRRLRDAGLTLAIVSSNSEPTVRRTLGPETAGLIRFYECKASIFGKAAKFRRVLKRSGVAAAEAITIGDEARDIEAARAAGIACGAVKWGYATPALLQSFAPNLLFDSMDEIADQIAA